jgi:hypothetical protein
MPAIQNQQTSLAVFVSINGTELTNHNRVVSIAENINASDTETSAGRIKRFYRPNKRTMSFQFSYLPNTEEKTADGRVARNFIENLVRTAPKVLINYKDDPTGANKQFYGFITSYSESIVRRDLPTQCTYYDVQFDIEEV